jgi:hypothetical protein
MNANTAEQDHEMAEDSEDTEVIQVKDTDNVGDASVEINVEELINELEADGLVEACNHEHAAKRRLEELMERRRSRKDLEDFDDYDI